MTSKEEAELLFKREPLSGSPRSIPEYEQRARSDHVWQRPRVEGEFSRLLAAAP
jgi:hypothetical protein